MDIIPAYYVKTAISLINAVSGPDELIIYSGPVIIEWSTGGLNIFFISF